MPSTTGSFGLTGFRSDIQGLRALAVILVVAFHVGLSALSGGFIGVDVFFVISGYLISGLLLREIDQTGTVDLQGFYARRARRLLPTAFVVLCSTLTVVCLLLSPQEIISAGKSAASTALYVSNFWFMRQTTDYFAPESALNPFLHTWSLSVEEQFYFVWPVFLMLVMRFAPRRLPLALIASTIVSLAVCLYVVGFKQSVAFYASPTRVWEFGAGALACLVPPAVLQRHKILAISGGWAGLVLVVGSALTLSEATLFPGWSAVLPVAGTVAMLLAGQADTRWMPVLSSSAAQYLGNRSYAIYLWHWPIVVLALVVWPDLGGWGRAAMALASVVLAEVSYRFIEQTTRHGPVARVPPARVVAGALAITLLGAGLAGGTLLFGRHLGRQPQQAAITLAQTEKSGLAPTCLAPLSQSAVRTCDYGSSVSGRRVVLFGDSHAGQWFTPVAAFAKTQDAVLTTVLKSSCAAASVDVVSSRLRRQFTECSVWRTAAIARIVALHPDLVILSEHSLSYVRRSEFGVSAPSVTAEQWGEGLAATLKTLRQAGIETVILADTPLMATSVPTCLARAQRGLGRAEQCGRKRSLAFDQRVTAAEKAAVNAVPGVRYIDLGPRLCSSQHCEPQRGDVVLERDANHISEPAARLLSEALGSSLRQPGSGYYGGFPGAAKPQA